MQFTPDGTQLLYVEYEPGTGVSLLKAVTRPGAAATQLARLSSSSEPIPTPDSRRVLCFVTGRSELMSVPLVGGPPTLIDANTSQSVEVSPDSRLVTLYQDPGPSSGAVLKIGRVAGGEPELVLKDARYPSISGAWVDAMHVIAVRHNVPPPLRFQNGVYRLTAE